jgi:hypothetical protein
MDVVVGASFRPSNSGFSPIHPTGIGAPCWMRLLNNKDQSSAVIAHFLPDAAEPV